MIFFLVFLSGLFFFFFPPSEERRFIFILLDFIFWEDYFWSRIALGEFSSEFIHISYAQCD